MTPVNVKKISVSALVKAARLANPAHNSLLFIGRVIKFKSVDSPHGTSLKLIGAFRAVMPSGEIYNSPNAYVPPVVESICEMAIIDKNPDNFKGFEIACRIFQTPSPKSVTGYEWAFETIVAPNAEQVDPLAHLMGQINPALLPEGARAALPAPTPAGTEPNPEKVSKKKN